MSMDTSDVDTLRLSGPGFSARPARSLPAMALILLASLSLLSCPPPIWDGALVYVKPASSWFGGDGSSARDAVCGLSNAILSARAGRTFVLLPGSYAGESAALYYQDFSEDPITILAADPEHTILDGQGMGSSALSLYYAKGVEIRGLSVVGYGISAIALTGCEGITIEDCLISSNGFGAPQGGDTRYAGIDAALSRDIAIRGNKVTLNGPVNALPGNEALATGISAWALRDSEISGNHVEANWGGGILVEDCDGVLVTDNAISGHVATADLPDGGGQWFCGGIWLDGGRDIELSANSLSGNRAGIYLSNLDVQPISGWSIHDNSLSANTSAFFINGFGAALPPEVSLTGNTASGNGLDQEIIDTVFWRKGDSALSSTLVLGETPMDLLPVGYFAEVEGTGLLLLRAWFAGGLDYLEFILPYHRDDADALVIENATCTINAVVGGKHYLFYSTAPLYDLNPLVAPDSSTVSLGPLSLLLSEWGEGWEAHISVEGSIEFGI